MTLFKQISIIMSIFLFVVIASVMIPGVMLTQECTVT